MYIMLTNLRLVLFFVCSIIKNFNKVLIHRLSMGSIVVYYPTIITKILNTEAHCMELRVVKDWLTYLGVDRSCYSNAIFVFFNLYNMCSIWRSIS